MNQFNKMSGLLLKSGLTLLCIALLSLFAKTVYSETFTVFGPKTYERTNGKPTTIVSSFSVSDLSSTYTLTVWNGGSGCNNDDDGSSESDYDSDSSFAGDDERGNPSSSKNCVFRRNPATDSAAKWATRSGANWTRHSVVIWATDSDPIWATFSI